MAFSGSDARASAGQKSALARCGRARALLLFREAVERGRAGKRDVVVAVGV